MENTALVLEGGGLRGVYTSGVLHYLMAQRLYLPYVIGVSMGACNGANYVSRQPERNRIVNISFVNDPRYLSYRRLLLKGELFGMQFIFDTIPHQLVPFDVTTFMSNGQKCITVVTDCKTGAPVYYEKKQAGDDYLTILQASCSLPFISRPVRYNGRILMDGGIADAIPIQKSIADGNRRHVLVLTQPGDYRKTPSHLHRLAALRYPKLKGLRKSMADRHIRYNNTMALVDEMEKSGKAFTIRPDSKLIAGRIEQNKDRLYATYDQGYNDAANLFDDLCAFLGTP